MTEHPPRLVFDDECGFCTWCAHFAQRHGDVELVGFHELSADQLARLPENYQRSAHLLTDDAVYSAGEAIERTLFHDFPFLGPVFDVLHLVPGYERLRESLYRWGADNRDLLGKIVRDEPPAKQ